MQLTKQSPTLLLLATMMTTGCDKAADLRKEAVTAQDEANVEIANTRSDAKQDVLDAQAEADKKIADAQAEFTKMREEYRHNTTVKLAALDLKIANLEARAKKTTGASKSELDAKVKRIQEQRERFLNDYKALENATGATWDNTRADLDRGWDELSRLVENA